MATTTYVPIEAKTLASDTNSVTFSNIPQTYTDLILICNASHTGATATGLTLRFNGDTNTNYSFTRIFGDGASAASDREVNRNNGQVGIIGNQAITSAGTFIINIQNYANTTTYKTTIARSSDSAGGYVSSYVMLWRATPAAITTIDIKSGSAPGVFTSLRSGSTFTLYGIANADTGAYASGGLITYDSTYYYHTFTSSGTFTPSQSLSADIMVIAGGGAGAAGNYTGGGGAGGFRVLTSQSLTSGTGYTATIGGGGAGTSAQTTTNNGTNSSFSGAGLTTITSSGGGGGGYDNNASTGGSQGQSGGSGGGNYIKNTTQQSSGNTGSYSPSEGNAGGLGSGTGVNTAGGGGGGSAQAGNTNGQGYGGDGTSSYSSWGSATSTGVNSGGTYYYAGGGGAGAAVNFALGQSATVPGGKGGGGLGGSYLTSNYTSGTANTGSGGGAVGGTSGVSGSGGSGIVIIRYAK